MRVLVACETSGIGRRAFAARGHDVWSCDTLPAEDGRRRRAMGRAGDQGHGGREGMIGATFCSGIGGAEVTAPWKAALVVRWIMERIRASAGEKREAESVKDSA